MSIWVEKKLGSGGADKLARGFASVAAEIVHHDDIAGTKRRQSNPLHIGPKAVAVDRSLDESRRIEPVTANCRQESDGLPSTSGNLGRETAPRGAHPHKGAMSALVQVSSMKPAGIALGLNVP